MKMTTLFKGLTAFALAMMLCCSADAFAAKKPKKEKITDPRLLTVMKMGKVAKESQFVTRGTALKTAHSSVQGFDVVNGGAEIWYSQPGQTAKLQQGLTKIHENYVVRHVGNRRELMTLRYFGNAHSLCVERTNAGDYVWVAGNATRHAKKGHYMRTRTLSRIPFEVGAEYDKGYAGETYYMGGEYIYPALQTEQDMIGMATHLKGDWTFSIYSLSEARAMPDTELKVKVAYKGENIGEETETAIRTFKGKDLSELEPITSFTVKKPEEGSNPAKDVLHYAFRAWDFDKDYVYFLEGAHNKSNYNANGPSVGYITVFDHAGRVVLPRRRIGVVGDQVILEVLGITPTGCAHIAGFKMKGNTAYLCLATHAKSGEKKGWRSVVVKYE
ncbi:MAG: hypothetical protein IJ348_03800 [Alistipes sp.]|nr:hypothetical protein [Alistipes sp.]